MSFLIVAPHDDAHAAYVELILKERGLSVSRINFSHYPENAHITQRIGNTKNFINFRSGIENIFDDRYSTVWWRRYYGFQPNINNVHPDDRAIVELEHKIYSRQFPYQFCSRARWINSPRGEIDGGNKPLQLRLASELGLAIPETLITNDREHAVAFLRDAARNAEQVVFKTLTPHQWVVRNDPTNYRLGAVYTRRIAEADLVDAEEFRICAGVFQHEVPSSFEVRVLFMGDAYVAMAHNFKDDADHHLDSRLRPQKFGTSYRHVLPTPVYNGCIALMKKLGLNFGCMDILVKPCGEHVFLEVNPQGAWLWMEHVCPEIKVLTPFCDFLVTGSVSSNSFERGPDDKIYKNWQDSIPESCS